ncbi:MAG: helix-turn-helix domain-containing protein [Candidatus Lokiarchaeota archaeon]|nr:helix-turn-helix domain-containing protein [Candidatus Lokiarchaeota archaeon]
MSKLAVPLIKEVSNDLNEAGFQVSLFNNYQSRNTSFDLIARRKELTLLIKCLYYIDKFKSILAKELKMISKIISGYPLIIGKYTRNKDDKIYPGFIYPRKGILAMNIETLRGLIENVFPIIIANRGKYLVNLNSKLLQERRNEMNLSLKGLADKIHISRRAISMYERGEISAKLEVVLDIEKVLNVPLEIMAEPLNIYQMIKDNLNKISLQKKKLSSLEKDFRRELNDYFQEIGLDAFWTEKSLFDAITKQDREIDLPELMKKHFIITGVENSEEDVAKNLESKSRIINNISRVLESLSMIVLDHDIDSKLNTPALSLKDLKKIRNARELFKKLYRESNY